MIRFTLLLLTLLCCANAYAQNPLLDKIEELKTELNKDVSQTEKARIYGDLSWYYNSVNLDSAFHYGARALEMARALGDRKLIAQSLSDIGAIYFVKGDVDEALSHYEESLEIRSADEDAEGIASLNFKLGAAYYRKMDLEKSMEYYLKSLKFYEEKGDESVVANLYSNIAITYTALRNYPKALEFLKKAEDYFAKQNHGQQLSNTLLATGNVYLSIKDTLTGIDYYNRAVQIGKESGNYNVEATAYNNLGSILTEQGKHKQAIEYINRALEIRKREKFESDAASANLSLAINHNRLRNFGQAKNLLLSSLRHFEATGFREKIGNVYYQLIPAYAGLGKMDSVFHYMDLFVFNASEVLNQRVIEVSNELETKYQTEKKEQQIELLNQEAAIQKLQIRNRNLFLLVTVFLLFGGGLTAYLLFRQRKLKEEARVQEEIRKQQEATTKAVLDAEEKERRRIAGDLHDGVGQLLSAALLNLKEFNKKAGQNLEISGKTSVEDAIKMVADSYDEMRSISHQMMPNALVKFGLVSAVREFINKIDGNVIRIILSVNGLEDRLESQKETMLYRVIQESVNNVIKHAKATQMSIQLSQDASGITLAIEDNGVGFDPLTVDWNASGLGLKNMRDRLELLNGELEIDSKVGRGTSLIIFVP